jgi:diacylglycerol kinase family enzyme
LAAGGAPPSCWRGGVVVANASEYAMRLNPARRADPADGLLDAVALRCRSAVGVAGWLARLAAFAPGATADVGRASAWRLRWDRPVRLQADGDPVPGGPVVEAEVEALPGALALVDVRPAG